LHSAEYRDIGKAEAIALDGGRVRWEAGAEAVGAGAMVEAVEAEVSAASAEDHRAAAGLGEAGKSRRRWTKKRI
jgi:hypothetical protein